MIDNILKEYGRLSFKCGADPLSAGISAGASLVDNIFGASNTSSTNDTNLAIARETNQMNYKIHQEDQQHEIDMFNRTNEYNTPEQQAARLRAAGINPSAVLGNNGSSGVVAASQPSAPAAIPMQGATMQPFSPSFKGISDAIEQGLQARGLDLNNKQQYIDLIHKEEKWQLDLEYRRTEIAEKLANKDLSEQERNKLKQEEKRLEQQNELHERIKEDLVRKAKLDADEVDSKIETNKAVQRLNDSLTKINNINAEWLPKQYQHQMEMEERRISIEYMRAIAEGKSAVAAENSARAALENALKTDGIKMDEDQRKAYIDAKMEVLHGEAERNKRQGKSWFRQAVDAVQDFDSTMNGISGDNLRAVGVPVQSSQTDGNRNYYGTRW